MRSADGAKDLVGLNRDTANANQALDKPDQKAMQERMDLIQSTVELGKSIANTIAADKQKSAEAQRKAVNPNDDAQVQAAKLALDDAASWQVGGEKRLFVDVVTGLLAAGFGGTGAGTSVGIVANTTAADTYNMIGSYAEQRRLQAEAEKDYATAAAWEEGGAARVLLHMLAGAAQGLSGGSVEGGALGAGASAGLMPMLDAILKDSKLSDTDKKALTTAVAASVGAAAGSGGDITGQLTGVTTAASVEIYNRQMHKDERVLISDQAKALAAEAGITEDEAKRRLAEAFAFYTDARWQEKIAGQGVAFDEATLKYLGIALAPLASRYDISALAGGNDVPLVISPDRVYTPQETLHLIQNYQLSHQAEFTNWTINAELLVSKNIDGWDQKEFYQKYLNYSSGFNPFADLVGAGAGVGNGATNALSSTASGIWSLGNGLIFDFTGTSSQIANGLMQQLGQADDLWQSYTQARDLAKAEAFLYRLQDEPAKAAEVEMRWETEFAANFLGSSRIKALSGAEIKAGTAETVAGAKAALPSGYREGSEVGAGFASTALLPEGYRRVINTKTGNIEVLAPDGLLYFEVEGVLKPKAGGNLSTLAEAERRVEAAKTPSTNIVDPWGLKPTDRGVLIETLLAKTEYSTERGWYNVGAERNGYFPLVDFQSGNTLVSLKSADTTGSTWLGRMQEHIVDLGTNGAKVGGVPASMVLDLRVQPGGSATAASLIAFGRQYNVKVIIKEFK